MSPVGWFELRDITLIGLHLVLEAMEKVIFIIERFMTDQSHQKAYSDIRKKDLEFLVGD